MRRRHWGYTRALCFEAPACPFYVGRCAPQSLHVSLLSISWFPRNTGRKSGPILPVSRAPHRKGGRRGRSDAPTRRRAGGRAAALNVARPAAFIVSRVMAGECWRV